MATIKLTSTSAMVDRLQRPRRKRAHAERSQTQIAKTVTPAGLREADPLVQVRQVDVPRAIG